MAGTLQTLAALTLSLPIALAGAAAADELHAGKTINICPPKLRLT